MIFFLPALEAGFPFLPFPMHIVYQVPAAVEVTAKQTQKNLLRQAEKGMFAMMANSRKRITNVRTVIATPRKLYVCWLTKLATDRNMANPNNLFNICCGAANR